MVLKVKNKKNEKTENTVKEKQKGGIKKIFQKIGNTLKKKVAN